MDGNPCSGYVKCSQMTTRTPHAICISGMHRSGTSMVAGLLNRCGVYLGESADFLGGSPEENAEGFREHFGFYALNERLLLHLQAGWDAPWLPPGWENRQDLDPFRQEARLLINRMQTLAADSPFWGWKDPRNAITLPFWCDLLPELKVVICVRNPAEVAASLGKRNNFSVAASSRLWLHYYQSLLTFTAPANRVITVYEHYFEDFERELTRLMEGLGLQRDAASADKAKSSTKSALRHNRNNLRDLYNGDFSDDLIRLYEALLREAATGVPPEPGLLLSSPGGAGPRPHDAPIDITRSRFHAETAQREEHMHRLSEENRWLGERLNRLEMNYFEMLEQAGRPPGGDAVDFNQLAAQIEALTASLSCLASCQTRLLTAQAGMEDLFHQRLSSLPRWIQRFPRLVATFRIFHKDLQDPERIRLENELHASLRECLHAFAELSLPQARMLLRQLTPPPGLEHADTQQTPTDISVLTQRLRQRVL